MSLVPPNGHTFTLGEHEARLENIERAVTKTQGDVEKLVKWQSERRGEWRAAAGIGGMVAFLLSLLFNLGK
jgi:hypothetical protein